MAIAKVALGKDLRSLKLGLMNRANAGMYVYSGALCGNVGINTCQRIYFYDVAVIKVHVSQVINIKVIDELGLY